MFRTYQPAQDTVLYPTFVPRHAAADPADAVVDPSREDSSGGSGPVVDPVVDPSREGDSAANSSSVWLLTGAAVVVVGVVMLFLFRNNGDDTVQ